jgi:energy-coupling factor transport system ATP-binding protein
VLHQGAVAASGTPREVFRAGARLEDLGLALPEAAQLMRRLRERGYPGCADALTIDEAERALASILEGAA